MVKKRKAILGRKVEVEPSRDLVEGRRDLAAAEVEPYWELETAMAFWKSERSSSSSGAVMVRRRGGRMVEPKKKRSGRERRRIRVGTRGEDGYENIGILGLQSVSV